MPRKASPAPSIAALAGSGTATVPSGVPALNAVGVSASGPVFAQVGQMRLTLSAPTGSAAAVLPRKGALDSVVPVGESVPVLLLTCMSKAFRAMGTATVPSGVLASNAVEMV